MGATASFLACEYEYLYKHNSTGTCLCIFTRIYQAKVTIIMS